MGKGIDLARDAAPEHAAILDDFKDQLLIAFVKQNGGKLSISVSDVDATGDTVLMMNVKDGVFNFEARKKQ